MPAIAGLTLSPTQHRHSMPNNGDNRVSLFDTGSTADSIRHTRNRHHLYETYIISDASQPLSHPLDGQTRNLGPIIIRWWSTGNKVERHLDYRKGPLFSCFAALQNTKGVWWWRQGLPSSVLLVNYQPAPRILTSRVGTRDYEMLPNEHFGVALP